METQILISVFNPYVLLGIGVALIAFEAVITSFVLVWFGIGFIITAGISYIYPFEDGIWQLAIVSLISLILIVLLRKKALETFIDSKKEINDNFFEEGGIGEIKNSKVFFKGTYWEIDTKEDIKSFSENERVNVIKTYKNYAVIEKK